MPSMPHRDDARPTLELSQAVPRHGSGVAVTFAAVLVIASLCIADAARAACNLIPRASTTFRSALGSTNRPFAAPGEFVELKLRPAQGLCDGASPGFDP